MAEARWSKMDGTARPPAFGGCLGAPLTPDHLLLCRTCEDTTAKKAPIIASSRAVVRALPVPVARRRGQSVSAHMGEASRQVRPGRGKARASSGRLVPLVDARECRRSIVCLARGCVRRRPPSGLRNAGHDVVRAAESTAQVVGDVPS